VDDASLQLDHEQHVVAAEQHGVDMEEVSRHDAFSLGRQEFAPGRTLSPGSRREAVPKRHRSHAGLRHTDPEILELADDPEISPSVVLSCQAQDQLHGLAGKNRTALSAVRVGPVPANKRAVPAEDCLRRDEERTPALKASEEGDEGTVRPGEAGTGDLAAKHKNLGILRRAI
jgi:hypothetical protein